MFLSLTWQPEGDFVFLEAPQDAVDDVEGAWLRGKSHTFQLLEFSPRKLLEVRGSNDLDHEICTRYMQVPVSQSIKFKLQYMYMYEHMTVHAQSFVDSLILTDFRGLSRAIRLAT